MARRAGAMLINAALTLTAFVSGSLEATTSLSNVEIPRDTSGRPIVTGETSILRVNDTFYYYVNDWGECAPVDCCPSPGGCASCCYVPPTAQYPDECIFTTNHTVLVYATKDFQSWQLLGPALVQSARPRGIEFRPHVVYNARTKQFVMWFEDRPDAITSSGYFVATSTQPNGPFVTVASRVAVADVPGDFDLLVDDDGTCYHVQTTTNDPKAANGFAITVLNEYYNAPAAPHRSTTFVAPLPAEGPVFFKRDGSYYILGGTTCCACRGGSSIYVFRAPAPLGPWRFVGDVGSNTGSIDPHSPNNFVTRAQASTVVEVGNQLLWLGNQWATSRTVNSGLLYWSVLSFDHQGDVEQFVWRPNATITFPN